MKNTILFLLIISGGLARAEVDGARFFIGTSAFVLVNLDQEMKEPPRFYQLNFGYQLTKKDVISVELITWRYYAPLGVTSGANINKDEKFPGYVSAMGAALAYQRFLWKGFYTALHGAWFDQGYYDNAKVKLGSGHQLFLTFRLGYHLAFFSNKFFIEPNVALTHWPINTKLPTEFQSREDKWPKHQVEPGFHLGYVF